MTFAISRANGTNCSRKKYVIPIMPICAPIVSNPIWVGGNMHGPVQNVDESILIDAAGLDAREIWLRSRDLGKTVILYNAQASHLTNEIRAPIAIVRWATICSWCR